MADPRISVNYPVGNGSFNFHVGKYSQFLHQVGFSQIGLASDFWLTANKELPKQQSYNFALDYSGLFGPVYLSITGYWNRVFKQPEYIGQVLDLLQPDYNAMDYIHIYNGFNTGVNISSHMAFNNFKANVGMGYGIARRKDKSFEKYIRGNTEPGFTCNINTDYQINRHWEVGARFFLASGRPYTPIIAMYMIAGNLIKEYGVPNSRLFPVNHRLDLSATWKGESKIKSTALTHLINLSVVNAYGRRNVEILTYSFDVETGSINLRKVYSLYRFLPSVSYTIKF